ncbi:MAG TPA: hypothetical protein VH166_08530 [Mycobacterium sp.]|nr:hypothetical protein [Mycobacterium sp.]
MDQQRIDELAWDIVAACREHLTVAELNMVFIKLGVGEYDSVIEAVLKRLARDRLGLSAELAVRLRQWVDSYLGSPRHSALTALLGPGRESS